MKYVNKFDTATQAIAATGLVAPQVVYVQDETKVLYSGNMDDNTDVCIRRDNNQLVIKKFYKGLKMTSTGNSTVALAQQGSAPTVDLKYSLDDGKTWTQWDFSAISLNDGDSVCFKGQNTAFGTSLDKYNKFVMTGSIAASGNIMSIIDDGACNTTTIPSDYCFCSLFYGCRALTAPPELPATTLRWGCYAQMFDSCQLLTAGPELPATTLVGQCYRQMFTDCYSIKYIKCLATSIYNDLYTWSWVSGPCGSVIGTFVKAANATGWTTGVSGIPSGWTVQDAA